MDRKRVVILAMLLVVVASIYFASERMAEQTARREEVNLAPGFDAVKAAAITIQKPGSDTVTFEKNDSGWAVTSGKKTHTADATAIAALLDQIGKMKSATAVSKNPNNFDAFEVSDSKAVKVKIQDNGGGVLAWVVLGKNGPDIFSTYVRVHNGKGVYLVPGFLKNSAVRELSGWRDKTLFKLDPDTIKIYSISGDRDLQLKKTNANTWQDACDGRVSDSAGPAAMRIINGFAALTAADFSESSMAEAKLNKPVRTITALLKNGSQLTLTLGGDKNAFQQFVKTSVQDEIYVVEKAQLDSLSPSCKEFKDIGKAPDTAKPPAAVNQ